MEATRRARPVIAIDGPAGAGKSTAARRLARRLGYVLVDTGALYRGVALAARERGIPWDDAEALGALARALRMRFEPATDEPRLWIDGEDRSADIRSADISRGASDVSRHATVRAALLDVQRELGEHGGVVLEGRDIGTVVFPDAEVKFFLTASAEIRARRRFDEQKGRDGPSYQETLRQLRARDQQDEQRAESPLKPAPDAIILDTSRSKLEAVVDRLYQVVADSIDTPVSH